MAPAKQRPSKRAPPPAPVLDDAGHEAGKATWYGGKHHGGGTASGEIFDQNAMTAAHKSLPFDTWVRVVNHQNGATALVRINDRGPYGKGRIIDVSFAAAKLLGMIDAGVVPVHLEIVALGHGRYQRNRKPPPGGPPTQ
ncbi:MAG: septal ring lytic transglycosylase RlpA family protein [Deltaproteobacteria bacterium]|nr:septal ring lytic transglycosylase RlpA family protein [Deltaproteobacteria bacterium]